MKDLAIVIPCATDTRLTRCLCSIDEEIEVVVALNGATDQVKQIVRQFGVKSCEINERNIGKACNAGIYATEAPSILMMNSDCVFHPGTIRRFQDSLQTRMLSRGQVVFETRDWASKIVAKVRNYEYSDPDNAYMPGLAFRKEIANSIGYYFDDHVHWAEDADFARRLKVATIHCDIIPEAILYHAPYSLYGDLRSIWRYGTGRKIAEEKQLVGTDTHYHIRPQHLYKEAINIYKRQGFLPALYASTLREASFAFGYYTQSIVDVYGVRREILQEKSYQSK